MSTNSPAWLRMVEAIPAARNPAGMRWCPEDGMLLHAVERAGGPARRGYLKTVMQALVAEDGAIAGCRDEDFDLGRLQPGTLLFPLCGNGDDPRYERALERLRAQLRRQPRTRSGGFWHGRAFPDQMWLCDLYMAAPFYARYAAAVGETEAFHDVAHQILLLEERARDPASGLLCHAWDESRRQLWANPETGRSSCCWGRALGWFALAIVDVLEHFPPLHPDRGSLAAAIERLAHALLRFQDPASGLWFQVVDLADRPGNRLEPSATCLIACALAKAVRMGCLPHDPFGETASRALSGVRERFLTDAGSVPILNGTSESAALGGTPYRDGSFASYVSLPLVSNHPLGIAAFILASIEAEHAA
jgi:unsaturated rhamnogalacturonyl hydrolase